MYSGFSKLTAPVENFMAVIESYHILRPLLIHWVAYGLPWIELIFGTFLVLGFLAKPSAFVLASLSAFFIATLSRSLLLHLPLTECGCFGAGITLSPMQALMLDSGLFLAAVSLFSKQPNWWSLDERLSK